MACEDTVLGHRRHVHVYACASHVVYVSSVCTFDIAGASQELLHELRREGRPGLWNSSDPLERSRPWRPYSELWMPGHETFKYVGPHLGLS